MWFLRVRVDVCSFSNKGLLMVGLQKGRKAKAKLDIWRGDEEEEQGVGHNVDTSIS